MPGLNSVIQRAVVTAFQAVGDIPKAAVLTCKNQREYDPEMGANLALRLVSQNSEGATIDIGNGRSVDAEILNGITVAGFAMGLDEREPTPNAQILPGVVLKSDAIHENEDGTVTLKFEDSGPLQEVSVSIPRVLFGNFEEKEVQRAVNRGDELLATDRKISIPRLYLAGLQPAKGDRITATDEDWTVFAVVTKDPASALVTLAGRKS